MVGLKSEDVEIFFAKILRFWKNDSLRGNFQNYVPKDHCLTDRRVVFKLREIRPTGNRKNRALFT